MKKHVLYFPHPVNTYDTAVEKEILILIQQYFPDFVVENPNQLCHQKGYAEWKKRYENTDGKTKSGMSYFFDVVMPNCDAGAVALPFLDGKFGAGVAGEVIYAVQKQRGIWLIEAPVLKIIRPFTLKEIKLLLDWEKRKNETPNKEELEKTENTLVLSIKETRIRTWLVLYKTMKPYETAHIDRTFSK